MSGKMYIVQCTLFLTPHLPCSFMLQVNKVAISSSGMIAIPQDNRHVTIYDIAGVKLSRLPRESGKCHMRMVSSVAWPAADGEGGGWRASANLFSAGFDRLALGWRVRSKVGIMRRFHT
jgi:hypothetical protein